MTRQPASTEPPSTPLTTTPPPAPVPVSDGAARPDPQVVGPAALKGLAHPLRVRLLSELSDRGRATATQLAEALGESSGATSYHLRQLHRHGFIAEDPTAGTGRERYWRPAPGGWNLPVLDLVDDATNSQAVGLVLREQLLEDMQRALRTVELARNWPEEWQGVLRRRDSRVSLTAEQTDALAREIDAVIDRYQAMPAQPGSRRVIVTLNTMPTEHPGITDDSADGGR